MAEPERQTTVLSEYLSELRARGISIGLREHFEVGQLLHRWPDDLTSMRHALGSILGTNTEEAQLVRDTFDEMFPATCTDSAEFRQLLGPLLTEKTEQAGAIHNELDELYNGVLAESRPVKVSTSPANNRGRFVARYWPGFVALLAMLALATWFFSRPVVVVPPPPAPPPPVCPDGTPFPCKPVTPSEGKPTMPPPNPVEILPRPAPQPLWMRSAGVGGLLGVMLFGLLYWKRTGREAKRTGYDDIALELESLDDPQTYEFDLGNVAPPFDGGLMDDVAMLLARQAAVAKARHELDVERSLERTLEAGLAPRLVFASRTSAEPVLILEDISVEMRWYRRQTNGFLTALRDRGVYIDHWQFDADAAILTHADSAVSVTFGQLIRQRLASPLVILSSGSGILDPVTGLSAVWIGQLKHWLSRAWLHPSGDSSQWRQAVHELPLPVWPMNSDGLISAARHLATGETDSRTAELRVLKSSSPVKPLHITRLRRLIDLAPRRDAGLAELLRQQFCPSVPEAAVAEAVTAPPLEFPAAIGPSDQEVREFLVSVLDRSRPPVGSAAELRWQLDRALLGIHVPAERAQSLKALETLVNGPLAAEVSPVVNHTLNQADGQHIGKSTRVLLDKKVLSPINRRAVHRGRFSDPTGEKRVRAWPKINEVAIPLLTCAAMVLTTPWLGAWFNPEPGNPVADYSLILKIQDPAVDDTFQLDVSGGQPPIDLWKEKATLGRWQRDQVLSRDDVGHWYWVSQALPTGYYQVSSPIWVQGSKPDTPVVVEPHRCYWLSNRTNQWQLMSRITSKQQCFEQDSCNGGLGRSAGGCYKWSRGVDGAREPWDKIEPPNGVPRARSLQNIADDGAASVYESSGGGMISATPVSGINDTMFSGDKLNNLMTITGQFLGIQIDLPAPKSLVELGAYIDPADRLSDRYKSTDQIEFFISTDNAASFSSVGVASFTPRALEGFSYGNVVGDFCNVTNIRYRFRQADKGREGQRILEAIALEPSSPSDACSPDSNNLPEQKNSFDLSVQKKLPEPMVAADEPPFVKVAPVYPQRAISRGMEGYVDLSFTVTKSGTVSNPTVTFSTSSLFERAALNAVLKYKYKPRVVNGVPVEVPGTTTRITFTLDKEAK